MNDADSDLSSPLLTPDGNEAVERCPICKRLNSPGACDTCAHFFGSYWDGEIIWSNQFEEFSTEWTALRELVEELTRSLGKSWTELVKLTKTGISTPKLNALDPSDCSASSALMELVDFDSGPVIVTDGMLSGEGKSLYLKNANVIEETISAIRLIRQSLSPRTLHPEEDRLSGSDHDGIHGSGAHSLQPGQFE
jgi:hypothetical protein